MYSNCNFKIRCIFSPKFIFFLPIIFKSIPYIPSALIEEILCLSLLEVFSESIHEISFCYLHVIFENINKQKLKISE